MKRSWIIGLALVAGLSMSDAALACSCVVTPDPKVARDGSDAVFSGQVTGIVQSGQSGRMLTVTLQVDRAWKGILQCGEVTLETAADGATCGFGFEQGKSYLVYAVDENGLTTNLCTRSRSIDQADEDLGALGEPEKSCPASDSAGTTNAPAMRSESGSAISG